MFAQRFSWKDWEACWKAFSGISFSYIKVNTGLWLADPSATFPPGYAVRTGPQDFVLRICFRVFVSKVACGSQCKWDRNGGSFAE